jgi:polyisoprenoid-binding protein YceI
MLRVRAAAARLAPEGLPMLPSRARLAIAVALALPAAALAARRPAPALPTRSLLEGIQLYSIDTPHSEVGFNVPWMGISHVHGRFGDFIGTLAIDTLDLTRSSIHVVIRTKSIDTANERRDKDLRGEGFFDVAKFPSIVFESHAIVHNGDGYLLRGVLTMHGVTQEIEIPFRYNGHLHDGGEERVGFEGRVTLARKDFGIIGPAALNRLIPTGAVIGDTVAIPLAIEGWRQSARDTLPDRAADSLWRAASSRGVAAVAKDFRALRSRLPDSLIAVDEGAVNEVGYQFLAIGRVDPAREMFQLECETWPANVFGYVGLGQAYATLGDREHAVATLERAITINPEAPRAQVILKRIRG